MQNHRSSILFVITFIAILGFLGVTIPAAAQSEEVLHSFDSNGTDGYYPSAGLVFDSSGNLYGAAFDGGPGNLGVVFQLVPGSGGSWTENILYSFCSVAGCTDGANPQGALVVDPSGNLYGTTVGGGAHGSGTVFELKRSPQGVWEEKVLHSFNTVGADGYYPLCGLVFDAAGNLYGTTQWGGAYNSGTVFRLSPEADGKWVKSTLHSFNDNGKDGYSPYASLIFDSSGNLYGTTALGGASGTGCGGQGCGTVFELSLAANGDWTEKQLHSFMDNGRDGFKPWGGLVMDQSGNLYGTTNAGGPTDAGCGSGGCGVVFELTHTEGKWSERTIHAFHDNNSDGYASTAGLTIDAQGNLYGTTFYGGLYNDGTVFQLQQVGDRWSEHVLHNFDWSIYVQDGTNPMDGLTFDNAGNLYGTTQTGGNYNFGAVFEITP